jgi:hypothetical protein
VTDIQSQEESEMKLVVGRDDLAAAAPVAARTEGTEVERLDVRGPGPGTARNQ